MNYNDIEKYVLEELEKICKKFIKLIDFEKITNNEKSKINTYSNTLLKKINDYKQKIKKIDQKIEKTYIDRLDDVISVDTYKNISTKFENDKKEAIKELEELEKTYEQYEKDNSLENIIEAKELAKEYIKKRKNIDRELILRLVDKIEIHEDKKIDVYLKVKPFEQIR